MLEGLSTILSGVHAHDFSVLALEPQLKDGGAFVKFQYSAGEVESALDTIINELRAAADKHGGIPSWWGAHVGNVWLVKGKPWREVSNTCCLSVLRRLTRSRT